MDYETYRSPLIPGKYYNDNAGWCISSTYIFVQGTDSDTSGTKQHTDSTAK